MSGSETKAKKAYADRGLVPAVLKLRDAWPEEESGREHGSPDVRAYIDDLLIVFGAEPPASEAVRQAPSEALELAERGNFWFSWKMHSWSRKCRYEIEPLRIPEITDRPRVTPVASAAPRFGSVFHVRRADWDRMTRSADPQTLEPPDASQRELARAKERIKNAFDTMPPNDALRDIRETWAGLDDAVGLAEARTRLLLGKIDPPKTLPTLPTWVTDGFEAMNADDDDDDDVSALPAAVESARRLIAASLAALEVPNDLKAEIDRGPSGQVVIDWRADAFRVQWMVGVSPISWPGVTVNALARIGSGRGAVRETRTFHDAFGVLEHFQEQLSRLGR